MRVKKILMYFRKNTADNLTVIVHAYRRAAYTSESTIQSVIVHAYRMWFSTPIYAFEPN